MIGLKFDPRQIIPIANLEKQTAFAQRLTITRLATKVAESERAAIQGVFDRPTPFTQRAIQNIAMTTGASATGKRQYVRVIKVKDEATGGAAPADYLRPQIEGGGRQPKKFERLFNFVDFKNGGFQTQQTFAVPGKGLRLNQYGNISRGTINQILSALKAFDEVGYKANITDRSKNRGKNRSRPEFFLGKAGKGKRTVGVWQRTGRGKRDIKPILIAVPSVGYRKIFQFFEIGEKVVARNYRAEFQKALSDALATARPE